MSIYPSRSYSVFGLFVVVVLFYLSVIVVNHCFLFFLYVSLVCFVQVVVSDIYFSFENIVVGVKAFVLIFQMYIDLYIYID
jgi:hypothetical protein